MQPQREESLAHSSRHRGGYVEANWSAVRLELTESGRRKRLERLEEKRPDTKSLQDTHTAPTSDLTCQMYRSGHRSGPDQYQYQC